MLEKCVCSEPFGLKNFSNIKKTALGICVIYVDSTSCGKTERGSLLQGIHSTAALFYHHRLFGADIKRVSHPPKDQTWEGATQSWKFSLDLLRIAQTRLFVFANFVYFVTCCFCYL